MTAAKNRGGRPGRERGPGERVPLGLRVTPDLKRKLDEAAERSGRSQSQEAELRLEQSFRDEDTAGRMLELVYGPELATLLQMIGDVMIEAGRMTAFNNKSGKSAEEVLRSIDNWTSDPSAYDQAVEGAQILFNECRPEGEVVASRSPTKVPGNPDMEAAHELVSRPGEMFAGSMLAQVASPETAPTPLLVARAQRYGIGLRSIAERLRTRRQESGKQ